MGLNMDEPNENMDISNKEIDDYFAKKLINY